MLRGTRPLGSLAQYASKNATARTAIGSGLTRLYTISSSVRTATGPTMPRPPRETAFPKLVPRVCRTQYSTKPPVQPTHGDPEFEKKVGKEKLEAHPDQVSMESSVRHAFESSANQDPDPGAQIKDDVNTIRETFALRSVPRESYALGLAGTLPYLGTSLLTILLSWNLNHPWPTDSNLLNSFLLSHENASHLLHLLEPIQIGYGALIISFLGAIHWGLELAEKSHARPRTTFRYSMGVIAPMLAWPTLVLPVQFALTAQFGTFIALYFADARATVRGWAPHWYGTYRFVLTAIVGAALFISLVGRAKVGDTRARLSTADLKETLQVGKEDGEKYNEKWERLEKEEKEKRRKEEAEKKKKEEEENKRKAKEEKKKGKDSESKDKKGNEKKADEKSASQEQPGEEKKDDDAQKSTESSKDNSGKKDDGGAKKDGNQDKGKDDGKQGGDNEQKNEKQDDGKDDGKQVDGKEKKE